jgi:hypothetical protein
MTVLFKTSIILLLILASLDCTAQTDSSDIKLNIFPNPNSGTFYITLVNEESYPSQLFSLDGTLVKTIYLRSGLNYVSIDIPVGIYMLKVGNEDCNRLFKVAIK